jgi:hypothetical protein
MADNKQHIDIVESKLTTLEKYRRLGLPEDQIKYFPEVTIDIIYDNLMDTVIIERNRSIMLNVINMILEFINKNKIDKIDQFLISRNELIKSFNAELFYDRYYEQLIKYGLDKYKVCYYERRSCKEYCIKFLRRVCTHLGYILKSRTRFLNRKKATYYFIIRI